MGKTGAKFVIGAGFALIFFSLFFTTWKCTSPENKAAYLAMKNHDLDVKGQEPLAPRFAAIKCPSEADMATKLGLTEAVFKDKLQTPYNDNIKKKFDDSKDIKKWNEDCDKAAKGDMEAYKDYLKKYGEYLVDNTYNLTKDSSENEQDIRNMTNEDAEEAAQVNQYFWHRSLIIYLGTLLVTAGFLMLAINGEGNEKLGALIGLAAVLFFIASYFPAGAIR